MLPCPQLHNVLASALHAEPLRVLLVTGGHVWDNSFHAVFDRSEADWRVTGNPWPDAHREGKRGAA